MVPVDAVGAVGAGRGKTENPVGAAVWGTLKILQALKAL